MMSPQQKRVILLLTVAGSIIKENDPKSKRHKLVHSRIDKAINEAYKKDISLMQDVLNISDKHWGDAIELFEDKYFEPTLFLSIIVGLDDKRFRDVGMSRRLIEDYYHPLLCDDTVEIERTTYELAIWFFDKISESLGIDGYVKKSFMRGGG